MGCDVRRTVLCRPYGAPRLRGAYPALKCRADRISPLRGWHVAVRLACSCESKILSQSSHVLPATTGTKSAKVSQYRPYGAGMSLCGWRNTAQLIFRAVSALQPVHAITAGGTDAIGTERVTGLGRCTAEAASPSVAKGNTLAVIVAFVLIFAHSLRYQIVGVPGPCARGPRSVPHAPVQCVRYVPGLYRRPPAPPISRESAIYAGLREGDLSKSCKQGT
jgi:hypothetical protein